MKIGILTYQNTVNYGAALQTYALQQACRARGHDVEVINYRSRSMAVAKSQQLNAVSAGVVKKFAQTAFIRARHRAFESFARAHLNRGEKCDTSAEVARTVDRYDVVLIGSDQVWNYQINGSDPAFFADFAYGRTRVASYGSSLGVGEIPESLHAFYRDGLSHVQPLGVREQMGADLLERVLDRRPAVVPDPVALIPADDWRRAAERDAGPRPSHGRTLVSYFLGGNTKTVAASWAGSTSLSRLTKVKFAGGISVHDVLDRGTRVDPRWGPFDFLTAVSGAKFVLTDSFHATMFASILDVPFGVALKGDKGKDARIVEALSRLGLSSRIIRGSSGPNFDPPSAEAPVASRLAEWRQEGLEYLSRVEESLA